MQPIFADYDAQISQVILSHYHTIAPTTGIDCYRHGRPFHGLIYALRGCAEYVFFDSSRLFLSQGEIALFPAELSYRMRCHGTVPFVHYTVNFQGQYDTFPSWIPRDKPYTFHPASVTVMENRFQELNQTWNHRNPGYRMNTRVQLMALLFDLFSEDIYPAMFPSTHGQIQPAVHRMQNDFAEKLTLDELAKECHLSVTSFRRLFCEIYHQSPISYLLELRIRKAKELLLLGLSLEEAALSTGFSSTNYFIRYFGRKTGVTPKAFQQENMK